MRKTKVKNFYEFYTKPCPICGKIGGCMLREDKKVVVCIRTESKTVFSTTFLSWVHFLDAKDVNVSLHNKETNTESERASKDFIHAVYSTLLTLLQLNMEHKKDLLRRGFTESEINFNGYKSLPGINDSPKICREIMDNLGVDTLAGVPGFYLSKSKNTWYLNGNNGMLIPLRRSDGTIQGMQYRILHPKDIVTVNFSKDQQHLLQYKVVNDVIVQVFDQHSQKVWEKTLTYKEAALIEIPINGKNTLVGIASLKKGQKYFWLSSANRNLGVSSESCCHVSIQNNKEYSTTLKANKVWLTEGPIKGDFCTERVNKAFNTDGEVFISVPGVGMWEKALPVLEQLGAKEIIMAYDRDAMENTAVKTALKSCTVKLLSMGYTVGMAIWGNKEAKGIDDLLKLHYRPEIKYF